MNDAQPIEQARADELIIDNLETLKVLADQLRKRIMEQFDRPSTVKDVARRLSTTPSKLYYHVNLLEEHGLLKVTDTRIVSGIIEKQYQAAARVFRVKAGLLSPTPEDGDSALETLLSHFFDQPKADAQRSVRDGIVDLSENAPQHLKLNMSSVVVTLKPSQATAFSERMRELVDEFTAASTEDEDDQAYAVQLMMFPVATEALTADQLDTQE